MNNLTSIDGAPGSGEPRTDAKASPALPSPVSTRLAKRKKDQRIRAVARHVKSTAPHLDDPAFAPLVQGFARISILLADSYEKIRDQNLIGEDGELRPSIETIRRLVDTQSKLAEKLGLTPATLKALRKAKRANDIPARFANLDDAE